MSEEAPNPEKTRRPKGFSSFLMFVMILMVLLVFLGGDNLLGKVQEFTQDKFEWKLHLGKVQQISFLGSSSASNRIEGKFTTPENETARFAVNYTSLKDREQEFREMKAREVKLISQRSLLQRLDSDEVKLLELRYLSAKTSDPASSEKDAENARDNEDAEASPKLSPIPIVTDREERILASVLGKSGTQHFDVQMDSTTDVRELKQKLEGFTSNISSYAFDLSEDATLWRDSTSPFVAALLMFAPWLLVIIVIMFVMRQVRSQGGAGGVMSFGKSRAQLYAKENHTGVTFDDMAGAEEAKAEVREVVEFLKNPTRFTRIGGRIPRGVLLVGSPGCGKTLLAKAIAGEAEVPFYSISGSDFVEMFVGVGASRVRDLFKQARENSPCIIFLDEIDAVGRRRGSGMGGGHDEREQTLNAILVEMDGFGTDEGIIVVAATNRPDVLDPALLRPGRFDREVTIELADIEGRLAILKVHIKRVKADKNIDLESLARSTPGYSGADLAAIVNEAAIMAVLNKRDAVSMEDLDEARDKVRYGRQKITRKIEEDDRRITAYHEAGHTVVAACLDEIDSPHKVTIVPRGRALGSTMVLPERESYHMQRNKLKGQLAMLFGGRIAEAIFCGDISAGASDDIQRATDLARAMVSELGMSDEIGPISYAERQGSDFLGTELMRGKVHSEETARQIDREVEVLIRGAYTRAEKLLNDNKDKLELVAQALLQLETISGEDIKRLLDGATVEELKEAKQLLAASVEQARIQEESSSKPEATDQPDGLRDDLPGTQGLSPA
jgi:cell division protease FtsH